MEIKANGVNLYYEVSGSGRPVVLLHGNGENCKIFNTLVKTMQSDYACYALDSRNHGNSQKGLPISYDEMTNDVASFIMTLSKAGFEPNMVLSRDFCSFRRHPRLLYDSKPALGFLENHLKLSA